MQSVPVKNPRIENEGQSRPVGSRVGDDYNPQSNDFPAASAGVLVWMAEKMIAQNSLSDAVTAMERLIQLYGDSGGDFCLMHYLIGKAKERSIWKQLTTLTQL